MWIQRIEAGAEEHGVSFSAGKMTCKIIMLYMVTDDCLMNYNLSLPSEQMRYNHLIHALKVENIRLDRKILADLAVNEPFSFKALVDRMKVQVEKTA